MMYKKIGTIDNLSEILFNKKLIVTGTIGNGWLYQMPGVFKKIGNKIVFRNDNDMSTEIDEKTCISLNVLERI